MYCNPGPDFTFCFIYLYWRDLYQWDRFWEYCSGFAALVLCNKHPPNLNGSQQQTCIPLLLLSGSTMTLQCSAGHKQTLLLAPGQIYDFSMCLFSGWSNNSSLEHTLTGLVKIGPHFLSLNLAYSLFHPHSHWSEKIMQPTPKCMRKKSTLHSGGKHAKNLEKMKTCKLNNTINNTEIIIFFRSQVPHC